MIDAQLSITSTFDKGQLDDRKSRVSDLQARSEDLHRRWISIFGTEDTPVPIDRAYHNLVFALNDIQYKDHCESRIELANDQLDQAEWIVERELSAEPRE